VTELRISASRAANALLVLGRGAALLTFIEILWVTYASKRILLATCEPFMQIICASEPLFVVRFPTLDIAIKMGDKK
jgi:hypothetical protein